MLNVMTEIEGITLSLYSISLIGGTSHRRKGAARHSFVLVGFIVRLSEEEGGILLVQKISTYLRGT